MPNAEILQEGASPTVPVEGLITKAELAQRLRRSTRTVDDWLKRGRLPRLKIGRSVLFRWSVVLDHLERQFGVRP